jgi:hypothetical protein
MFGRAAPVSTANVTTLGAKTINLAESCIPLKVNLKELRYGCYGQWPLIG